MYAQISEGGLPPSFTCLHGSISQEIPSVTVAPDFDVQKQIKADSKEIEGMTAVPLKMGKILPVNLSIENSGEWINLPDGVRIWRLAVKVPNALATSLYYDKFIIPEGGKLFIYSSDKRQIIGAYTSRTNPAKRLFATELVYGDEFTIEYVSSLKANETGTKADIPHIEITGIAYVYNHVRVLDSSGLRLAGFGNSGSCEVNVNCEEGANWQDQKKGVVKTISRIGNTTYLCSGTIINNVSQDLTPYYLSAYHCFANQTAEELEQTGFYFHYETAGCANEENEPTDYKTLIGAEILVLNPIGGGSDGALLLLKDRIPVDYEVFFNGWDRRNIAPSSGVGIHHPHGDVKKISTYTSPASSSTWVGDGYVGASDAHWDVRYVATPNGWGVAEQGSSGSPLFNQNGLVVGTLTGGTAECLYPNGANQYGKLWYHWDQSPDAARHIKTYLDPMGTGIDVLAGTYTANNSPYADFRANYTNIFALQSITYTNQSLNAASHRWIFDGGIPNSANERNPGAVTYPNPGTFTTTLIINEGTPNERTKTISVTVDIKGGVAETPVADFTFLKIFFEENFDDTFPPANWTLDKKGESNKQWFASNISVIGAERHFSDIDPANVTSAVIAFDDYSLVDSWLISPTYQVPANANLEFYAGYSGNWLASGFVNLLVSNDNGNTWTEKWTNGPDDIPGLQWGWRKASVDLSAYGGQSIKLAWQYYGKGGDMAGIDGVKIIAPLPVNTPLTIYVGDSIYPVDFSTGPAVLYEWTFEGGTPASSQQETPVVHYFTAGTHNISLRVKNTEGEDEKLFTNAVTVLARELQPAYDAQGGYTRYPNFGKFIPVGATIKYIDKTVNYPMTWNWTFAGGDPASSSAQNPSVVYNQEGNYGFDLTLGNALGEKNIAVTDFIKVGGEEKIWNMNPGETGQSAPSDWLAGYETGTNRWGNTHFAERFEAPLIPAVITKVDIDFFVENRGNGSLEVAIMDDDGNGFPGRIIDKVNLPVSAINEAGYTTVNFPNPVPVSGTFYVSVGNFYNAPFQIAIKHQNRYVQWKKGLKVTTFVYKSSWESFLYYLNTSYISMNVVPTVLYGSYMSASSDSDEYQRKSSDASVATVNVHSNIAWQATASKPWIEISGGTGFGDGSFTFTVQENTGKERRGIVSVGAGELQKSFIVEQAGPPASNLATAISSQGKIELKWNMPEIQQLTSENKSAVYPKKITGASQLVNLCWSNGEMFDIFGKETGGTYEVAIRFDPDDLFEYHTARIKEVEIYIDKIPLNNKLTLKLHQGGKTIYSQEMEITETQFVSIPLNDTLYIDSREDLYVGYEFTQAPRFYVAGADEGPAVPGKGNLVSDDGGESFYSLTDYNIDRNWLISMWIDTGSRIDYLIWRDDQKIGETTELTYHDQPQNAATYCYKVTARYGGYLSTIDSNPSCIEYTGLNNISVNGIKLYPNPAKEVLTVSSDRNITGIVVTDATGRIIFSDKNTEKNRHVINTSSWTKGIYIARISTGENDTVCKIVKE